MSRPRTTRSSSRAISGEGAGGVSATKPPASPSARVETASRPAAKGFSAWASSASAVLRSERLASSARRNGALSVAWKP